MAKPQLYFPSRENRQKLLADLNRLAEQYRLSGNEAYKTYLEALKDLDERMDQHSALGNDGLPQPLTGAGKDKLLASLVRVAEAGERFIVSSAQADQQQAQGNALRQMAPVVDQMQSLMSRDFNALESYDPVAAPKSLPELQADARTRTIDLRGRKLKTLGNAQNTRIAMNLVNAKGVGRKGVFTRAKYLDTKAQYLDIIRRAKDQCKNQAAKDALDNLLPQYRSSIMGERTVRGGKVDANTSDNYIIGSIVRDLRKVEYESLDREELDRILPGLQGLKLPKAAVKILTEGLDQMRRDAGHDVNNLSLELKDGDRMDNRNAAMSAVASLLGISKAIVKSENVKVIGEDGSVTEGNFMEFAKGVDLEANTHLFKHVAEDPFQNKETAGEFYRKIADLQILDHICMNTDRHPGNMSFQVDQQGQLLDFQGFDNDNSFGRALFADLHIAALRVVSQSMAERLDKLTPEMLKFSLRGRGLSQEELNFAGERLQNLKGAITEGKIKTVPDKDFGQLPWKDLSAGIYGNNLFSKIGLYFGSEAKKHREGLGPFTPMPEQPEPKFRDVSTTERKQTVGGLKDALGKVERLVDNDETGFRVGSLTTRLRGSSPQFDRMVRAAKETAALQKQLTQNEALRDELLLDEGNEVKTARNQVDSAYNTLETAAMDYLRHKAGPNGNIDTLRGKNKYERARIDYARNILKAVDQYRESLSLSSQEEVEQYQENVTRRSIEQKREQEPALIRNS